MAAQSSSNLPLIHPVMAKLADGADLHRQIKQIASSSLRACISATLQLLRSINAQLV